MEDSTKRKGICHNQPNRNKLNDRIYVALVILIVGVLLLFILECYDTMRSECYVEKGKYNVIRKKQFNANEKTFKFNHVIAAMSEEPQRSQPTAPGTEYRDLSTPSTINRTTHERTIDAHSSIIKNYSNKLYEYRIPNTNTEYHVNNSHNLSDAKTPRKENNLNDIYTTPPTSLAADDIRQRQIQRQLQLRNFCLDQPISMQRERMGRVGNLLYSDVQGVIYCSVPKAACTNWKRMMQVFDGNIDDPLQIKRKQNVHKMKYSYLQKLPKAQREWKRNLYYSFMFVRHPLERLLSAYRNKLLDPYNAAFQRRYGSRILKLYRTGLTIKEYKQGKNVTFREFVDFLIYVHGHKGAKHFDEHWQIMHTLCSPCSMKYNYIGKMETLLSDANQVLREIGLYGKVKFPANATDKYKLRAKNLMKEYYSTISKSSLDKLFEIYEDDFLAFDYKITEYL